MSQRAAMARALAPRPNLLLLDEPLGALDSLTRTRLQKELLRIWEHEGVSAVMVTHDIEEAIVLSTRVIVMDPRPGRVRYIVPIEAPHPRRKTEAGFVAMRERIAAILEHDERTSPPSIAPL
jgi:sulfonate transport system ATP-binding protein